jgi:hypothetical protein
MTETPDLPRCDDGALPRSTTVLREDGAHRFNPVRFRYIEALERRAASKSGELRQALDRKLEEALAAYDADYAMARCAAADAITRLASHYPEALEELQRLHASGDFGRIRRLAETLEARNRTAHLADLVDYINRQASEHGDHHAPAELKALRHFRSTWTLLNVDRQISRSLAQAPENPGPLNSHLLVLRSLRTMQQISPAYLSRFIAQIDALLWLQQANFGDVPDEAKLARRESDKKRKVSRRKSS